MSSNLFNCSCGKFTQFKNLPSLFAREENSLTNSDVLDEYFEKSTPEKTVLNDEFLVYILTLLFWLNCLTIYYHEENYI